MTVRITNCGDSYHRRALVSQLISIRNKSPEKLPTAAISLAETLCDGPVPVLVKRNLCRLLTFFHLHSIDCERCDSRKECWGSDMRKRLEELRLPASTGTGSQPSSDKGNAA